MNTLQFLIYGLVDPRTLLVRYVGLSRTGMVRPYKHGMPSCLKADGNTHKANWIRSLQSHGLKYEVVLFQESSPEAICDDERWWIAFGRACGWPLTNVTDGGDRVQYTPEVRAKMSAARRARVMSPLSQETKNRIGAANKGKVRSPELRALWSAQRKGQPVSAATRAKIAAANRGRKMSAATLEKLRAANTGRVVSVESRAKMSAAREGTSLSPEWRTKIANSMRSEKTRAALRAAWVRRKARATEGAV